MSGASKSDFLRDFLTLARECGILLSEEQAGVCFEHVSLTLEWNRRCNLTRITDAREIIEKHLLDSLIPAKWLPRTGPAMDIGTGPGFPGIPLKVLHPELEMLLLESNRKKVSFLKVLLSRLSLQHIQVIESRWEDLLRGDLPLLKSPLRLATMRAVKLEPVHLTQLASALLRPGGVFAWWGGPGADLRWQEPYGQTLEEAGMVFEGCRNYSLPSASQPRHLFLWKKTEPQL